MDETQPKPSDDDVGEAGAEAAADAKDDAAQDADAKTDAATDAAVKDAPAQDDAAADAKEDAAKDETAKDEERPARAPELPKTEISPVVPRRSAPGEVLITARDLTKYYRGFVAVRDVSFEVRRGEVVAFLGPNGAGKSTTMKILTGVIAPSRGTAEICGFSSLEQRIEVATKLGYLPENGPLYEGMTPEALLRFLGAARGLGAERLERRIAQLRDQLQLGSVMAKSIHKLSRGFRQRVGLAQALVHEPDVLILDEPTNGLDPNQIREVRRVIRTFGKDKAVLLSTHILQEVEAVCDRVVFINEGRIVFTGSVEELKDKGETLDGAFAAFTRPAKAGAHA
ncbi:MAG: ATP-binding cassette domain-containing protein [Planctomycetota bacterium]